MRAPRRLIPVVALSLAASSGLGCWAISKRDSDVDRAPVVNHGAGATVIYPGQASPPHPGNYHPRQAGYGAQPPQGTAPAQTPAPAPQGAAAHLPPDAVAAGVAQPPPEYASRTGSPAPARGSHISMLGGAEQEITQHVSINEEPRWLKYAALPFAVVAAPFSYGYEKLRGEPEAGPAVPRNDSQPRPERAPPPQYRDTGAATPGAAPAGPTATSAQPPPDYESARLQGLERELAQRQAAAPPAYAPAQAPAPATSIADELARLRRQAAQPSRPTQLAAATPPRPYQAPRTPPQAARSEAPRGEPSREPHGVEQVGRVDRDGDGRIDHWIERRDGVVVAERFDDDFDSRPDRTLVYDPASREVIRIEEDTDHDGRLDSWTSLRDGQLAARRVDGDGDGEVDSWSHYRGGVITRLERDADGDGFRDLVAYYRDGRLDREERDGDGDGITDLVRYYDEGERVQRVEEDADGDGEMDVVSHYEGGRLTRREVLDASVLEAD